MSQVEAATKLLDSLKTMNDTDTDESVESEPDSESTETVESLTAKLREKMEQQVKARQGASSEIQSDKPQR
jgi:hypothetical protein